MWAKRFPKLAGAISPGPTVAPVGESQPAIATRAMSRDLTPQSVPNALPQAPKLRAQPTFDEATKRRALANIAMGRKGF